jgi:hypothetical protein
MCDIYQRFNKRSLSTGKKLRSHRDRKRDDKPYFHLIIIAVRQHKLRYVRQDLNVASACTAQKIK